MIVDFRFIISCIVSGIVMFLASYFWHGVFLNDLSRLPYSINVFFIFAPIAYFIISIVVTIVCRLELTKAFFKNVLLRGFTSGLICGFFIYIVSIVVGISFTKNITLVNFLFDLTWQMLEQGVGGMAVSIVYFFSPNTITE